MGEAIRVLAEGSVSGQILEIELNKPHASHMDRDIHIQSDAFRYQLKEREFVRLALTVLWARRHLSVLKGLDVNE